MPEPWTLPFSPDAEWLEPDGRGGFASGTVAGERTRRYHALLLSANAAGRWVLVNGLEVWLEPRTGGPAGKPRSLSTQRYEGDVVHPRGRDQLVGFRADPWPVWTFRWADGLSIEQELLVLPDTALTLLRWRLLGGNAPTAGEGAESENTRWTLHVRPLLSGRDYHGLHRENATFDFHARAEGDHVVWRPYPGVPATLTWSNGGRYVHGPQWYRNFLYREERARGLDGVEDLASPGTFSWPLRGPGGDPEEDKPSAILALAAEDFDVDQLPADVDGNDGFFDAMAREEIFRRQRLVVPGAGPLGRSGAAYLVRSHAGGGRTIIAGYPWFTDWGRDTFIALRGLCLALGRLDEAGEILLRWAGAEQGGMLPNRFPDGGQAPEFNAVDASLWFVIAAHEFLALRGDAAPAEQTGTLRKASDAILEAYVAGTGRFNIGLDPSDGLLSSGVGHPGVALTWMDAVVAGQPITPRAGKAVEIQALWLNALHAAGAASSNSRWRPLFEQGLVSFHARFWMPETDRRFLRDVVDVGGQPGASDERFRPNQIFAVGGLPLCLLPGDAARDVVAAVEERLWTPLGLRTLAPGEPDYAAHYAGGAAERDAAYHQGTAWPWLLGPFVEAWVRVHGGTAEAKRTARERFLRPLLERGSESALGHLPEIADAEPPYAPRGCPFQAWSVGEALRLDRVVLS